METASALAYASSQLAEYGWSADQLEPLITLWEEDSNLRAGQLDRGLKYIKERYGSPANALKFRDAHSWY